MTKQTHEAKPHAGAGQSKPASAAPEQKTAHAQGKQKSKPGEPFNAELGDGDPGGVSQSVD